MVKQLLLGCFFLLPLFAQAEIQLTAGIQTHEVRFDTTDPTIDNEQPSDTGYHFGIAARRHLGKNQQHRFGFGVDVDEILGDTLIGLHALDYQYVWNEQWRSGFFFGAASLDTGASQNGFYFGTSVSATNVVQQGMDIVLEARAGSGLARDRLLPDDPPAPEDDNRPDIFLDFLAISLSLSYRF